MQFFGTIKPIMVKAPNLVQMRLISHRSIIEVGEFGTFIFLADFQYAHFTQRLSTVQAKTDKPYFYTLINHIFTVLFI